MIKMVKLEGVGDVDVFSFEKVLEELESIV